MTNMSYCRFENTTAYLDDCVDALIYDGIPEDEDERAALLRMRQLAKDLLHETEHLEAVA